MSDDLVEGLRLVGRTFMPELMHGSANEIERLRAEVGETIAERDRLFIRGREWAELSGRMERERDALRESNKALHRRCQQAESAVPEYRKILALPPNGDGVRFANGNLGRILANAACEKLSAENDALRARIEGAATGKIVAGRSNSFGGFHVEVATDIGWSTGQRVALVVVDE